MAFLKSIEKAQNQALCQFCEEKESKIKWKCINCDLLLCQLCTTRIHSKIKASKGHKIINLKDCGTEDATNKTPKVDLKNMQCETHSEQKYWMYCTECRIPICTDCSTETHQKHELRNFNEVFDTIVSEIKELKGRIEMEMQWYENEGAKFKQLLSDGKQNFQETKDKILKTEKEMKETISRYASDLLQDLETKWRLLEKKFKVELSSLAKNQTDLESQKDILNETLQSKQSLDIFTARKGLNKELAKKPLSTIQLKKTQFIPGIRFKKFKSEINYQLFGYVTDI
ncbi:E3 ubiquitin-protein ligase TRIM45-like [Mytilus trossulus]|uniref:E3 ubiquitin-protein ligase TRIM45-like n=1 Tax=Mytilus trossulus TaxID=6551 RepID=UPI003004AF14